MRREREIDRAVIKAVFAGKMPSILNGVADFHAAAEKFHVSAYALADAVVAGFDLREDREDATMGERWLVEVAHAVLDERGRGYDGPALY